MHEQVSLDAAVMIIPITDNPDLISFSGGRTSAMMTEELLKVEKYRENSIVAFTNTGLEDEETLIFIDRCSKRWQELYGIEVVWLEYTREGENPSFKIVDFATASREGEPFSALLEVRNSLPNIVARYCTRELKIRTIKRYMMSLGFDYWTNVIGIRYDEPTRWGKAEASAEKDRWEVVLPLVTWRISKPDVIAYWKNMPFDLDMEDDCFGNCSLCFLKGKGKKKKALRLRPKIAEFWLKWEAKRGATFSSRYSVQQLLDEIKNAPELFDADEPDIDCVCE